MKNILFVIMLLSGIIQAAVIYVDGDAASNGSGASLNDAYNNLTQTVINTIQPGDEVRLYGTFSSLPSALDLSVVGATAASKVTFRAMEDGVKLECGTLTTPFFNNTTSYIVFRGITFESAKGGSGGYFFNRLESCEFYGCVFTGTSSTAAQGFASNTGSTGGRAEYCTFIRVDYPTGFQPVKVFKNCSFINCDLFPYVGVGSIDTLSYSLIIDVSTSYWTDFGTRMGYFDFNIIDDAYEANANVTSNAGSNSVFYDISELTLQSAVSSSTYSGNYDATLIINSPLITEYGVQVGAERYYSVRGY